VREFYKLLPTDPRWLQLDDLDIQLEYQLIRLEIHRRTHKGKLPPRSHNDFDSITTRLLRGEFSLDDFVPFDPDSV
jgi:hypothetical protein